MYEELIEGGSPPVLGPAIEPVTVAGLAAFGHFDAPPQYDSLSPLTPNETYLLAESFIKASREQVEQESGYALITQTWRLSIDRFPGFPINSTGVSELLPSVPYYMPFYEPSFYQVDPTNSSIELMRKKVRAINSIKYVDPNGDLQTFDADNYTLFANTISLKPRKFWPTCAAQPDCVRIEYEAGFGNQASDVPERLITAIKYLANHWYENRSMVATEKTEEIMHTFRRLLTGFRRMYVAR